MKQAYQNSSAHKQKQRLGSRGGALTLDAFVKAKSRPQLNPSDIIKKRQYYENAKKVKKYKTLLKHLPEQEHQALSSIPKEAFSDDEAVTGKEDGLVTNTDNDNVETGEGSRNRPVRNRRKLKKRKNALETLREEFEKKRREERQQKEERDKARKLKEEAQMKASQNRKDLKLKMFKKTRYGQPLMKHRLEHILDKIQQQ